MEDIKIIIDNDLLEEYYDYYFRCHRKAVKKPIETVWHTPMNQWMTMQRMQLNTLKQKWHQFSMWIIRHKGYANLRIKECSMAFITYYNTNRRHDVDAATPKFILDGFVESGFIIDDDWRCLHSLFLACKVDEDYPRTEIYVKNIVLEGE